MHRLGPLEVAGVEELLAEPRRAAIVDRQHGVAPVGEQLVDRVVAPRVARPRPTVNEQHHRHRRARQAVGAGVARGRQRQIADQGEPVARLDLDRGHLGERQLLEVGAGGEQEPGLLLGAIPQEVMRGVLLVGGGHHPGLVIERARRDLDTAAVEPSEVIEVALDRGVEDLPGRPQVVDLDRLHGVLGRVEDDLTSVGARVLRQHGRLPAGEVDRDQRGGVAAAAVAHVQRLAARREVHDVGRACRGRGPWDRGR